MDFLLDIQRLDECQHSFPTTNIIYQPVFAFLTPPPALELNSPDVPTLHFPSASSPCPFPLLPFSLFLRHLCLSLLRLSHFSCYLDVSFPAYILRIQAFPVSIHVLWLEK